MDWAAFVYTPPSSVAGWHQEPIPVSSQAHPNIPFHPHLWRGGTKNRLLFLHRLTPKSHSTLIRATIYEGPRQVKSLTPSSAGRSHSSIRARAQALPIGDVSEMMRGAGCPIEIRASSRPGGTPSSPAPHAESSASPTGWHQEPTPASSQAHPSITFHPHPCHQDHLPILVLPFQRSTSARHRHFEQ